jgi:hypothetical protein
VALPLHPSELTSSVIGGSVSWKTSGHSIEGKGFNHSFMIADGSSARPEPTMVFVQFLDVIHILDKEKVSKKRRRPAIRHA